MNKFLKDLNFCQVEAARNIRWYQKEYHLVGMLVSQIQNPFINIQQNVPGEGKFWLTVRKSLTNKEIRYMIMLDSGQGRAEGTVEITEYQAKSLLLNWEDKLKQYNIYK